MNKKRLGKIAVVIVDSYIFIFCVWIFALYTGNSEDLNVVVRDNIKIAIGFSVISVAAFKCVTCLRFWSHDFLTDFKRDSGIELWTIAIFVFLAVISGWESNIAVTLKLLALLFGGKLIGCGLAFITLQSTK